MPFTGDVCRHFEAIRQPDAGDFAQRGVRFLRRRGVYARAHAPLLRITTQVRRLFFLLHVAAAVPDELVDGRQIPLANESQKAVPEPGKLNVLFELGQPPETLRSTACGCGTER